MRNSMILLFAITVFTYPEMVFAADFTLDTAKIEEAAGAKGTLNKDEGVFKISYPRNDVKVRVEGMVLPPFMGLTGWAAFMPGQGQQAMVMGDLVLFEDEVNPAMSAALDAGLSVTALHNHFFYDEPKAYFMHVGGEGDAVTLAAAVKKVQDKVQQIRSAAPQPANSFGSKPIAATGSISAKPIEDVLGKGQTKDGMVKVVIGRKTKMPCGCEVGKEMGVNTWAAFYGTDEQAIVDGDFVVYEGELQGVLKSLRSSGINILAIHNHMESENPKLVFLHYWGRGPAADLAKSVKAALVTKKIAAR